MRREFSDESIQQFAKELPRQGVWWRGVHVDVSKLLLELLGRAQRAEEQVREEE